MTELKPCPFCGGSVTFAVGGSDLHERFLFITRGNEPGHCTCRVFMEGHLYEAEKFDEAREEETRRLAEAWNRRTGNG